MKKPSRRNTFCARCSEIASECNRIDLAPEKSCSKCRRDNHLYSSIGRKMKLRSSIAKIQPNIDSLIESKIKTKLISDNGGVLSKMSSHRTSSQAKQLIDLNANELQHIEQVNRAMFEVFSEENKLPVVKTDTDFNWKQCYIRKALAFAQQIPAFASLSKHNQLVIIKYFSDAVATLRVSFCCDLIYDGFPVYENEKGNRAIFIKFNIYDVIDLENVKNIRHFFYALHDKMENDSTVRNLLIVRALFESREQITCTEFLKYHHAFYSRLLYRYMVQKYQNISLASKKYSALLETVSQMDVAVSAV